LCLIFNSLEIKSFMINIDFQTQLLSPHTKEGYQSFLLSKYKEYNPSLNDLKVNFIKASLFMT
jgi:hypothetical protein